MCLDWVNIEMKYRKFFRRIKLTSNDKGKYSGQNSSFIPQLHISITLISSLFFAAKNSYYSTWNWYFESPNSTCSRFWCKSWRFCLHFDWKCICGRNESILVQYILIFHDFKKFFSGSKSLFLPCFWKDLISSPPPGGGEDGQNIYPW